MNENVKNQLQLALVACVTMGLAPFFPEPHIWGKLKWVLGGGKGMGSADYFDLVMHGAPWIFLIIVLIRIYLKTHNDRIHKKNIGDQNL